MDSKLAFSFIFNMCFGRSSTVSDSFNKVYEVGSSTTARVSDELVMLLNSMSVRNKLNVLRASSQSLYATIVSIGREEEGDVDTRAQIQHFQQHYVRVLSSMVETHLYAPSVQLYCIEALNIFIQEHIKDMTKSKAVKYALSAKSIVVVADVAVDCMDSNDTAVYKASQTLLTTAIHLEDHHKRLQFPDTSDIVAHILLRVASVGKNKRSKYRSMFVVTRCCSASRILHSMPNFVPETIHAMAFDKGIRSPAAAALKCIWKGLSIVGKKCESGPALLDMTTSMAVIQDVCNALLAEDESIRLSTIDNILPSLIENCPDCFFPLLKSMLNSHRGHTWTGSCISFLTIGRQRSLYSSLDSLEENEIEVYTILKDAIADQDEHIQISALNLLVTSPKAIDAPNEAELQLLWNYFNMSIRCSSALSRKDNLANFAILLTRMKVSAAAVFTRPKDFSEEVHKNVQLCEKWLQSFSSLCIACLHPGSVYGKCYMAVEFLCMMLEVFGNLLTETPVNESYKRHTPYKLAPSKYKDTGKGLKHGVFYPFSESLLQKSTITSLCCALLDTWDKIRSASMNILLMLPTPLNLFHSQQEISNMFLFASTRLQSPRLSDLDAGGRMLLVIYNQCIKNGLWRIQVLGSLQFEVFPNLERVEETFIRDLIDATSDSMDSVPDLLGYSVGIALSGLAALRYLVPLIPPGIDSIDIVNKVERILSKALESVMPILSSPEDHFVEYEDNAGSANRAELIQAQVTDEQIIRSKSWIVSKEICHLVQSCCEVIDSIQDIDTVEQCRKNLCQILMKILFEAKHYGSIDYAKIALESVCTLSGSRTNIRTFVLDQIMEFMLRDQQSRRDAIRRSGGLPFGIHSIMISDVKSRMNVTVMEKLLLISNTEATETSSIYWPCVHALNTLRLIFSDNKLSSLEQFYGEGFKVILKCLSSPHWEIRNSAALCFTALVSRVTGFSNIRRVDHVDMWPLRSPTASDFLENYKEVDTFIHQTLLSQGEQISPDSDQLVSPMLALLGRLRPDPSRSSAQQGKFEAESYMVALKYCIASKHMPIRKFASRAFVSVVPCCMWAAACSESVKEIDEVLSQELINWNVIHGRLCVLVEILKTLYSFMDQIEDVDVTMVHEIGRAICTNLDSSCTCRMAACPPVTAEFLKVCTLLCRIESKCQDKFIFDFCSGTVLNSLWDPVMGPALSGQQGPGAPMLTLAMKRIVKLSFIWSLPRLVMQEEGSSFGHYLLTVMRLIQSSIYEVREAALKSLAVAFNDIVTVSIPETDDILRDIYVLIQESWLTESSYFCRLSKIQLMNIYHEKAWSVCSYLVRPVVTLDNVNNYSDNPELICEIIKASAYAAISSDGAQSAEALGIVLHVVTVFSQPQYPEDMRYMCIQAMEISNILSSESVAELGRKIGDHLPMRMDQYMGLWSTCMMLLEDEDEYVRNAMARTIQIQIEKNNDSPSRVDRIQETALPWLVSQYQSHPIFVHMLQTWICKPRECKEHFLDKMESAPKQIIFLKEKENQYEDPLVLVNLASRQLASMTIHNCVKHVFMEWFSECIDTMIDILNLYNTSSESFGEESSGLQYRHYGSFAALYQEMYSLCAAIKASILACRNSSFPPPNSFEDLQKAIRGVKHNLLTELLSCGEISGMVRGIVADPGRMPDAGGLFQISHRLTFIT